MLVDNITTDGKGRDGEVTIIIKNYTKYVLIKV